MDRTRDLDGDTLAIAHVRAIVDALSLVAACAGDGAAKKRLLMERIADHIGADRWVWSVCRYNDRADVMPVSFLHSGFSDADLANIMEGSQDPRAPSPEHAPIVAELQKTASHFTRRRDELLADDAWDSSPHIQRYRRALGINECLWSIRPLDQHHFSAMGFHRLIGRPAFDPWASLVVHITFGSAAMHTLDMQMAQDTPDVLGLPPRLRTTFGLMLEGFGRADIASSLGISRNTAAEYMSTIYRHFRVAGHRELLRLFRSGDGGHRAS
ncbi:MAG: hypothetical protein KF866_11020 [Phycisphaeraceae bacterium]|nr:hypothetical protein [Phycisphaeraceae bacterium]MCW5754291.1 hypothetical protein [Phycisphaeraceae bacterium]